MVISEKPYRNECPISHREKYNIQCTGYIYPVHWIYMRCTLDLYVLHVGTISSTTSHSWCLLESNLINKVFDRPLFLIVKIVGVVKKVFLCIIIIQNDNGRYTNILFIQAYGSPILCFYRSFSFIPFFLYFSKGKSTIVACWFFNDWVSW